MTFDASQLEPDDWRRIRQALEYMARDLHHRSFAVTSDRRPLLWDEMDRCLALADRVAARLSGRPEDDVIGLIKQPDNITLDSNDVVK